MDDWRYGAYPMVSGCSCHFLGGLENRYLQVIFDGIPGRAILVTVVAKYSFLG